MWKIITPLLSVLTSSVAHSADDNITIDLEGLHKSSWSVQETKNVELITDFVQHLMNNHDFDYVLQHYNDSSYVQHNRNIPNKVTGLVGFLQQLVVKYPDYTYDVKHIFADGDYVIFHSHATLHKAHRGNDQKGLNIIDTWRIADGKIVEHWDSIQALDTMMRLNSLLSGGKIRNANGVF